MINKLILLFFKNKKINIFFITVILFLICFYSLAICLNYFLIGDFVFNISNLIINFKQNIKAILMIFLGYTILLLCLVFYFSNKYNKLKEQTEIKTLQLSDISFLWTRYNNNKSNNVPLKTNVDDEPEEKDENKNEKRNENQINQLKLISFQNKSLDRFFQTNIIHNVNLFSSTEISIIVELLLLLKNHGSVSSVASEFTNDNEEEQLTKILSEYSNGKSNYSLLKKICIREHSINVADIAIILRQEELKNENISKFEIELPMVIIAALSHDIGKIIKQASEITNIPNEVIKKNNHSMMSVEFFDKLSKDYNKKDSIKTAIISHHLQYTPEDALSRIIYNADKKARKKESEKLIAESANAKSDDQQNNNEKETPKTKSSTNSTTDVSTDINIVQIQDKFVQELSKNLNKLSIKDSDGMPLLSTDNITTKEILSITDEQYAYFNYALTKECMEVAYNNKLNDDDFKEQIAIFKQKKIIEEASSKKMLMHKIELFKDLESLGVSFMFKIKLKTLGLTKFDAIKNRMVSRGLSNITLK